MAGQKILDATAIPAGNHIHLQNELDGAITLLICMNGIPPTVADSAEWRQVWILATNNKYKPPSANTLVDTLIPSEAACVNQKVLAMLHSEDVDYVTIGFDGSATSGHNSFTSVHVTTSDCHALFLGGEHTTDVWHTGKNYAETLEKVSTLPLTLGYF